MGNTSCYMCYRNATSREHAPPRCLFPETKDTPDGANYRKNLVTVPSCEQHNSEKSHDDEYLLFVLSGSYTSSSVGLDQFLTKVRRAFEKRPGKAANFIRQSTRAQIKRVGQVDWEEGAQIIIDGMRVDKVLQNCARAIYYHHTGLKSLGSADALTSFAMYRDEKTQVEVDVAFNLTAQAMATEPLYGENPEIFEYKFKETESMIIFYFYFYTSSTAIIRLKKF